MADQFDRLKTALADRYTIERELGAGGMATVYLAEDVKHHRHVALKVLRPELAAILGAERFLKEIEVTANLQHPNILPLYDSGEADSFLYYVMPYMEGESLREKMNREKQLGVEETVELAKAVCRALDYAHEQGIVHRDIKPENILLQRGQPLVADFGIALAVSQAGGARLTETGLSLGTPHYMSPEQATGDRELDARSDVYSVGAMIYEMLVGEPPHDGKTMQAIIAKILSDTPAPIARAREFVPQNVDAAVQKALAKSPADRFPSAGKFAGALSDPTFTLPTITGAPVPSAVPRGVSMRTFYGVTSLAAIMFIVALWGWLRSPTGQTQNDAPVRRLTLQLPDSAPMAVGTGRPAVAVTPDGSRIIYVARVRGEHVVVSRDLRTDSLSFIPGSTGGTGPFVSSSGTIGFVTVKHFLKAPPGGGGTRRFASVTPVTRGAAWLTDSIIAVVVSPNSGILEAPSTDGLGVWMTDSTVSRAWPEVLPGTEVMLTVLPEGDDPDGWRIAARHVSTGVERVIIEGGSNPRYLPDYVVFLRQGSLWAVPFDADRLEVRGAPVLVQPGVLTEPDGFAHFALSREGTLVYASGGGWRTERRVVWVSADGSTEPLPFPAGAYNELALAPGGRRVALTRRIGSNDDIWIGDLSRGSLTPETRDPGEDGSPIWSPDGRQLAIATEFAIRGPPKLAIINLDGGVEFAVDTGIAFSAPTGWSVDGTIFFTHMALGRGSIGHNIGTFEVANSVATILLETTADERSAVPSPDGRWLAYASDESGRMEVYLRGATGEGSRVAVSRDGGVEPKWGRSGQRLYFRKGDRIFSVTVSGSPGTIPDLSTPQVAFQLPASLYLTGGFNGTSWDLALDERRVLALEEVDYVEVTTLHVVLNWVGALNAARSN